MILGPVFSLELVTTTRRLRYLFLRAGFAAFLLFTLYLSYVAVFEMGPAANWQLESNSIQRGAAFASYFFKSFSWLELLAIFLLAPIIVAGTIAQDRERRTIEYLFTTTLSNSEIVLGKLAVRLLQVLAVLAAGFPVLFLAMLMGGIAPGLLLALIIASVSSLFLVTSIAMLQSVWASRVRAAVTKTYAWIFLIFVLPLFVRMMPWFTTTWVSTFVDPIMGPIVRVSPFSLLWHWSDLLQGGRLWQEVVFLVGGQLAISFGCLAISVATVRRVHLREVSKAGPTSLLLRRPRPSVWPEFPLIWKEAFIEAFAQRHGAFMRVLQLFVLLAVIAGQIGVVWHGIVTATTVDERLQITGISTFLFSMAVGMAGVLFVAARAAGAISSERERESWDSLVSTDLTAGELVAGKFFGALFSAWPIALTLFAIACVASAVEFGFLIPTVFELATFGVICMFASALGILLSLYCATSLRAIGATVAILSFVGGGFIFFLIPFFMHVDPTELIFAPIVPFLLGCPYMFYVEARSRYGGSNFEIIFAYFAGNVGYFFGSLLLLSIAIGQFRNRGGRMESVLFGLRQSGPQPRSSRQNIPQALPVGSTQATSDSAAR